MAGLRDQINAPITAVLATDNAGKLREFRSLLGDCLSLIPQSEFGIRSGEETGSTFTENALIKARHAATLAKLPAIADDSGLEVDSLDGAPGIRSARYAGEDSADVDNVTRLLAELNGVQTADRTARFRCVAVFVRDADDPAPLIAEGIWEGRIGMEPSGENGFGYDPVFVDPELGLTAAQLNATEKNRRSHRGAAAQQLGRLIARAAKNDKSR
ncbi:MAG: RdgB/HAM1 family non-canonical purine NTP pyrophosphatase [Gammaproteobacteria bacterium]|nr:RdgB/HAM1 family non-canonical purine NTP pyrophosphatase [Gammaproteobacteria bacterium]